MVKPIKKKSIAPKGRTVRIYQGPCVCDGPPTFEFIGNDVIGFHIRCSVCEAEEAKDADADLDEAISIWNSKTPVKNVEVEMGVQSE